MQLIFYKKHFFAGLSYVGNDDTLSSDVSVSTDVVMKLKGPNFQLGFNVTCDDFFTSLTWHSHSLKRRAVSLEQCHKTRSSRRVQKEKGAVQNRSVSV